MTIARAHLIDTEHPGFYHLISRCVRRAWLCGFDAATCRSFEHRRAWIEQRLVLLSGLFAVELYAYAVMSNHYHVVLWVDPKGPATWSDEEVARRWLILYPPRAVEKAPPASGTAVLGAGDRSFDTALAALLAHPERLSTYRERLGSVSWFMRLLNEPLARWANAEDGCTGHFWEGRFKSQALLDETSVYACMAYVDLNPLRAGLSENLAEARHTSIAERLRRLRTDAPPLAEPLGASPEAQRNTVPCALNPLAAGTPHDTQRLAMMLSDYLNVLRAAAPQLAREQEMASHREPWVADSRHITLWRTRVAAMATRNRRAFGAYAQLEVFAHRLGQRWVAGMGMAIL